MKKELKKLKSNWNSSIPILDKNEQAELYTQLKINEP